MSAMIFTGIDDRWMSHLGEISELAGKLPDGAARIDAFAAQMEAASDPDAFMLREADPVAGDLLLMPGPLALAFLADLRAAVAAKEVAA